MKWGNKKAPPIDQTPSSTAIEIEARLSAGWALKMGYPVVFNENYEVGNFTYYCSSTTTPSGRVWRIPTKQLP